MAASARRSWRPTRATCSSTSATSSPRSLCEFKVQIAEYLADAHAHVDADTGGPDRVRQLALPGRDCPTTVRRSFEASEATSGDLTDPTYVAARTHARTAARAGIDDALARDRLDAIVAPHLTNSTGPAVAGYPNLSLPVGIRDSGSPAGMLMYSTFLREPQLIGFGYDLEQELNARVPPRLLGSIPDWPTAGICTNPSTHVFTGQAHLPHGRIF